MTVKANLNQAKNFEPRKAAVITTFQGSTVFRHLEIRLPALVTVVNADN